MHWEWVVPVIAVVLWILSSVIRTPEEPPRDPRRRRVPGGERPAADAPRAPSEVDRFLQEINKLRRGTAEEPKPTEPRAMPAPLRPLRRQMPTAQAQRRARPTYVEPQHRAPLDQQAAEGEMARSLFPQAPVVALPASSAPRVAPAVEVLEVLPANASVKAVVLPELVPVSHVSPAVTQLLSMLRSPQTVQTAVLLNEVLGAPRCRKKEVRR